MTEAVEKLPENPRPLSVKSPRITLNNPRLVSIQRTRVLLFNLLAVGGCLGSLFLVWRGEVSALDIGLLVGMYILTMTGITVGYHRYLAHKAFEAHPAVAASLTVLGAMAGQGPPIYWVANHRRHHQYSDQPGDPHSPHFQGERALKTLPGLWHAHLGWLFDKEITNASVFAKDLLKDPAIVKLNHRYMTWLILGWVIPALIGGIVTGTWWGLLSGFWWGGITRLFLSMNGGYAINSITHVYGSRPFQTREKSTNQMLVGVLTLGEGWHNNHHAFPNSAKFGLEWWQWDFGYWVIRALESGGVIWGVKAPSSEAIEAKKSTVQEV